MATKKKTAKVSKGKTAAQRDKVLAKTLVKLTQDHANLFVADDVDRASTVVSRSGPYPVKGKGTLEWFRQVAILTGEGESKSYGTVVEPADRPRSAVKLLRLLKAAK